MTMNEESNAFGMGQGCALHGDEHMKECSMCGAEFCRICIPRSTVCPDCAEPSEEEDEEEEKDSSDFDDIARAGMVIEEEEKDEKEEKTEESTEDVIEEDREKD